MTKMRKILVNANYGWEGGNRSTVIEIPEDEMQFVEEYVENWVMTDTTWTWEDITRKNEAEDENLD